LCFFFLDPNLICVFYSGLWRLGAFVCTSSVHNPVFCGFPPSLFCPRSLPLAEIYSPYSVEKATLSIKPAYSFARAFPLQIKALSLVNKPFETHPPPTKKNKKQPPPPPQHHPTPPKPPTNPKKTKNPKKTPPPPPPQNKQHLGQFLSSFNPRCLTVAIV